jgi:hypothetical protein
VKKGEGYTGGEVENKMEKQIAYCGLVCTDCGAYIATQTDDDKKRAETAVEWSKKYNIEIKPEDINCDGCIEGTDRIVNHCNVCEVRKCGREKQVVNCVYCDEYICETLDGYFKMAPQMKASLDEVRKGLTK